jgi:hypothetical protein
MLHGPPAPPARSTGGLYTAQGAQWAHAAAHIGSQCVPVQSSASLSRNSVLIRIFRLTAVQCTVQYGGRDARFLDGHSQLDERLFHVVVHLRAPPHSAAHLLSTVGTDGYPAPPLPQAMHHQVPPMGPPPCSSRGLVCELFRIKQEQEPQPVVQRCAAETRGGREDTGTRTGPP